PEFLLLGVLCFSNCCTVFGCPLQRTINALSYVLAKLWLRSKNDNILAELLKGRYTIAETIEIIIKRRVFVPIRTVEYIYFLDVCIYLVVTLCIIAFGVKVRPP